MSNRGSRLRCPSCHWRSARRPAFLLNALWCRELECFCSLQCPLGASCCFRLLWALFVCSCSCIVGPRSRAGFRLGEYPLRFPAIVCAATPTPTIAFLCYTQEWSCSKLKANVCVAAVDGSHRVAWMSKCTELKHGIRARF